MGYFMDAEFAGIIRAKGAIGVMAGEDLFETMDCGIMVIEVPFCFEVVLIAEIAGISGPG